MTTPKTEPTAQTKPQTCHSCGLQVPLIWWAPDNLWFRVTGERESGVRCLLCFDREAAERGVLLRWSPEVMR